MDIEQGEMQSLGFFGVCKEASKIMLSRRKIFTQITLTLILPLSFLTLLHVEVSNLLYRKIHATEYHKLDDMINSKAHIFVLYQSALFSFVLLFSLSSTSAVVYTVASIYTAKVVTFKKVMSVVPMVLESLLRTFIVAFTDFMLYNLLVFSLVLILFNFVLIIGLMSRGVVVFLLVLFAVLDFIGFVYITVVWQLASVRTMLEEEDSWELRAIVVKGHMLIKGKMVLSMFLLFTPVVFLVSILILFQEMVVKRWSVSPVEGTAFGVLCFLLLSCLFLFWLVVRTVFYFVCKPYLHQNCYKLCEMYGGEYVQLKANDVQLKQV